MTFSLYIFLKSLKKLSLWGIFPKDFILQKFDNFQMAISTILFLVHFMFYLEADMLIKIFFFLIRNSTLGA